MAEAGIFANNYFLQGGRNCYLILKHMCNDILLADLYNQQKLLLYCNYFCLKDFTDVLLQKF